MRGPGACRGWESHKNRRRPSASLYPGFCLRQGAGAAPTHLPCGPTQVPLETRRREGERKVGKNIMGRSSQRHGHQTRGDQRSLCAGVFRVDSWYGPQICHSGLHPPDPCSREPQCDQHGPPYLLCPFDHSRRLHLWPFGNDGGRPRLRRGPMHLGLGRKSRRISRPQGPGYTRGQEKRRQAYRG